MRSPGRHAPAFPGGVVGNEAGPVPHPCVETTNEPRPGSRAPRANHQSDSASLAQESESKSGDLASPS